MTVYDVYGERKREQVMLETWGHERAQKGQTYTCYILVCQDNLKCTSLFDYGFFDADIGGGPWFLEDVCDFALHHDFEQAGIWKWQGWYEKFKNDNYRFGGGKWELVWGYKALSR